jgi:hypothetical protein
MKVSRAGCLIRRPCHHAWSPSALLSLSMRPGPEIFCTHMDDVTTSMTGDEMVNGQSDIGVAAQASPQAAAYQALLDQLERVLPPQNLTDATEAYEECVNAYAQAVADPLIRQRVTSASQRLADVLNRVLDDSQVRGMVHEATTEYLRQIGEAWPRLTTEDPDSQTFAAVATGMTTLAYLYGMASLGFADQLGVTSPFAPATLAGSWSRQASSAWTADVGDDPPWGTPAGTDRAEEGQIVKRAAPSQASGDGPGGSRPGHSPAAAPRHGGEDGPSASARKADSARRVRARETQARETRAGEGPTPADPVQIVEHAYAAYVEELQRAEASVPKRSDGLTLPQRGDGGPRGVSQPELDQRTAELISAYLRLAHGIGYAPNAYLSYFRLRTAATELAERQLTLFHSYERLLERAVQATPTGKTKKAVDAQYQRFLTAVRTAWSQVDPSSLRPEQLSAITASTARAASLYLRAFEEPWTPKDLKVYLEELYRTYVQAFQAASASREASDRVAAAYDDLVRSL